MKVDIKVVPNASPDADGQWVRVDVDAHDLKSFWEAKHELQKVVPEGYHIVAYKSATA